MNEKCITKNKIDTNFEFLTKRPLSFHLKKFQSNILKLPERGEGGNIMSHSLVLPYLHKGRLLKGVGRWVHQKEIYYIRLYSKNRRQG